MRHSLQPATQYAPWFYELSRLIHKIPGGRCRLTLACFVFEQVGQKTIFVSDIFSHAIHYEVQLLDSLLHFCDLHGLTLLFSQPIHSTQDYIRRGFVSHFPSQGIVRYEPENQKAQLFT